MGAFEIRRPRRSPRSLPSHDAQRTRSAHKILQQFEGYGIADLEIIETGAFLNIRAMKKDFSCIWQADETMALAKEELDDSTGRALATGLNRP
jgi:hypothetical protein